MVKYKGKDYRIPYNKPHLTSNELNYIKKAYKSGKLSGDGEFTQKCQKWLQKNLKANKVLLTHSATAALEMMALISGIEKNDEVIMPSFTFVTTASSVVLRGAVPVFVDVREDTLNIDENLIEKAITKNTKAISVVHYAGVGCEMDKIKKIAQKHNLLIFEDAAQGILARYKDKYLGTIGDMAALSFHETKNIISGEGGALLINSSRFEEKAEIVWEKGTDRSKFMRGEVDKYKWVDLGSSYLASEIVAAFLFAQLEKAKSITKKRIKLWNKYHKMLEELEKKGNLRRPVIPDRVEHNAHIYYIILENKKARSDLIKFLKKNGVLSVFHYIPLHSSPAGKRFGRTSGSLKKTKNYSERLLRLPMYFDLKIKEVEYVCGLITKFFS